MTRQGAARGFAEVKYLAKLDSSHGRNRERGWSKEGPVPVPGVEWALGCGLGGYGRGHGPAVMLCAAGVHSAEQG